MVGRAAITIFNSGLFGGVRVMGADGGGRAIVGQALAAAGGAMARDRAAAEGEQLSMLAVPIGNPRAKHLRAAVERRNKAGRPPGAVNKSAKELREYLLARGVHPLQRMMEFMLHSPQSLAVELNCSMLEAALFLRELWKDAAPYFAPKLVPTDTEGRELPFFQMIVGGQHAHLAAGEGGVPWLDPATGQPWGAVAGAVEAQPSASRAQSATLTANEETQQNQALLTSPAPVSHGPVSHGDGK